MGTLSCTKKWALREASIIPETGYVIRCGYGRWISILVGSTRESMFIIGKRGISYDSTI
jgi:hypothetical protein